MNPIQTSVTASETVPASLYEVECYEYNMHSIGKIKEIFIPSIKIVINGESFFHCEQPRNIPSPSDLDYDASKPATPAKEIQLSKELVEKIKSIVIEKQKLKEKQAEVHSDLKKFWK